jgi:hypothetical protein
MLVAWNAQTNEQWSISLIKTEMQLGEFGKNKSVDIPEVASGAYEE